MMLGSETSVTCRGLVFRASQIVVRREGSGWRLVGNLKAPAIREPVLQLDDNCYHTLVGHRPFTWYRIYLPKRITGNRGGPKQLSSDAYVKIPGHK